MCSPHGICTGDRYLLKLFHDWLFHPTGGAAASPVLDWGRIVESLNKLDAGVPEQVSLMSRDEASLLVSLQLVTAEVQIERYSKPYSKPLSWTGAA